MLALIVIAWVLADSLSANAIGPVLTFPDQGHDHIAPGQPHPTYNSDPATSGWHREEFPPTRGQASELIERLRNENGRG